MEIEPERMDPRDRRTVPPFRRPPKWQLAAFGALALIIGGALLFFMFWVALFFAAIGVIMLGINLIRSWLRGESPGENSNTTVRFTIGRSPPED